MGTLSELADRILDRAEIAQGMLVLDVGAGAGLLGRAAAGRGANVVSIDLDAASLSLAEGTKVLCDVRLSPFADATFDVAMMRSALVWIQDRASAMRELFRVVRPGGVLAGAESLNSYLELRVHDRDLSQIWTVFQQALLSLGDVTLSETMLGDGMKTAGFREVGINVEEEIEDDPYELIMQLRPPGGFTIAEYLVAGGIDAALVEGFADGVRRNEGTFVTHHALFRARRP